MIDSSDRGRVLGPGEHPDFSRPLIGHHDSRVATTGPIGDEDPPERGQRHVMAFVPLSLAPWGLSLGGSEAELLAESDVWRSQIIVFGGLSLVIALFLVWIITRSVARPVRALTIASRRIALGDLATPIHTAGEGEVRALAEAFDDMRRHLQQALTALSAEKSRYEGIVGSMADAVFTTDAQLKITAFNPAAEKLLGWRAEDVLGRSCCEIVPSVDDCGQTVCPAACPIDHESNGSVLPTVTKEMIATLQGRTIPVATVRSTIRDLDGTVVGVVHVLRDVSAERELTQLKDQFLSMVSHELRTPLGYIKGYATTLLLPDAPVDQETIRNCLRVVVDASDELEELVGNLLEMSKIGAGAFRIEPQPVQLAPLVRAAIERVWVRANGHRLRVGVPADLCVVADPHRAEQVFFNLLDNALKYSSGHSRITVTAKTCGDKAVVGVADNGPGIPAEEMDLVFQPFHRGRNAQKSQVGGSGLDLAICKGIVEAHSGTIWVESPAGDVSSKKSCGTVIRFTLPVVSSGKVSARRTRRRGTSRSTSASDSEGSGT